MKSETYRAACEQAKTELKEIVVEFELLRMRKEQIEQMIAVLEPLSGPDNGMSTRLERTIELRTNETPATSEIHELVHAGHKEMSAEQGPGETYVPMFTLIDSKPAANEWEPHVEPAAEMEEEDSEPVFKAEEVSADPIKRRIANALRHRAVSRDSRDFNQAFSGSITRW